MVHAFHHLPRVATLLLTLSTPAVAAGSAAGYEYGGPYARFAPVVEQYNASGELFRIDGHCQSACTLFLAIRNVCIGPGASLLFHAAHNPQRVRSEFFTKLFLEAYNPKLRGYLLAHHALDQVDPFFPVSGADLIQKFGYRRCPAR